jgi:hypothetical protein
MVNDALMGSDTNTSIINTNKTITITTIISFI